MALRSKSSGGPGGWKKARIAVLLALIPGLIGLLFIHWPVTSSLETSGLDLLFQLRGPQASPSGRMCVVSNTLLAPLIRSTAF